MWSEAVKELPKKTSVKGMSYMHVKKFIEDILDNHTAKLERIFWEGDYVSVTSAHHSLKNTIKEQGYPIKIYVRGEELYLERRDI